MVNVYFVVILSALLCDYLLGVLSDLLALRALAPRPPEGLNDIHDEKKYALSQSYSRARIGFGLVTSTLRLTGMLLFWFMGGFQHLDTLLRGLHYGELVTGVLYIGVLSAGLYVLTLPFTLYGTFVIEERFGFNKTTLRTFIADRIKGLFLAALLGGAVLFGLLWFFGAFPRLGWLYAWGAVTAFSLLIQFLAPTYIMPLFNKFTPLPRGELKEQIEALAGRTGFPLGGIYVIDGSRRSSKANAFFTGFGKTRRIALYDTLIEEHSTDEIVSVLAHEIGHWKRGHILKSMVVGVVETGVNFWLLSLFLTTRGLPAAFGVAAPSVYTSLIFFGLLYTPVSTLLAVVMHGWSRRNEYEADAFAVDHAPAPEALVPALKRLAARNLSNLTPHPFNVFLHYSHPPLGARIAAIEARVPHRRPN